MKAHLTVSAGTALSFLLPSALRFFFLGHLLRVASCPTTNVAIWLTDSWPDSVPTLTPRLGIRPLSLRRPTAALPYLSLTSFLAYPHRAFQDGLASEDMLPKSPSTNPELSLPAALSLRRASRVMAARHRSLLCVPSSLERKRKGPLSETPHINYMPRSPIPVVAAHLVLAQVANA